jgi:hypothetical protein
MAAQPPNVNGASCSSIKLSNNRATVAGIGRLPDESLLLQY